MAYLQDLKKMLIAQDKEQALALTHRFLEAGNLLVFYEEVIPEILNSIACEQGDYTCVYHEHRMSAMMRMLVEVSYDYVLKAKQQRKVDKTVLVACLKGETHELGAVIGSYLLEYYGFKTILTGADTPLKTLLAGIAHAKCDYLVLSVTNAYNLVEFNKVLANIKAHYPKLKIYGAGRGALKQKTHLLVDGMLSKVADIEALIDKEGL